MSKALVGAGLGCVVFALAACGGGGTGGMDGGDSGIAGDGAPSDVARTDSGRDGNGGTDGGTRTDSGGSMTDSGTASTDSGNPPADSGPPPADSGSPSCGARTTFLDGFVPTRTLYVAPGGSDSNDGLTLATAWASLANASQLQPGDRLEVKAGTYACGANITVHGTAAHPIQIHSADGPSAAVFDCTNGGGFLVTQSQYLAFDGLEVKNAMTGHLFNVFSAPTPPFDPMSDHVLFIRNHLHDSHMACIKSSQSIHIEVVNNEIDHADQFGSNQSGQAIDMVGNTACLIADNHIHDVTTNVAAQVKGGEADTVIDNNEIHDVYSALNVGGSTGPQYFVPQDADYEGLRVIASNNRIWNAQHVGIAVVGCHDCLVANNTIVLTGAAQGIRGLPGAVGQNAPASAGGVSYVVNLRLINNIVYINPSVQDLLNFAAGNDTGFVQSNNLFFATSSPVSAIYSDVPVGGPGTMVDQDPMLGNPGAGDLTLRTGSPAIGAGTPLTEVTHDAAGNCRTQWNIGAY